MRTFYLELDVLGSIEPLPPRKSLARKVWAWLRMTVVSLPYFLGLRESCRGFTHLEEITGDPPLPPAAAEK